MKHCIFLILMHQSSKSHLSLQERPPLSLLNSGNCWQLTAVCVNWRHPFRHTPLEKYSSCIFLLPYNSASVNYVPIRNHMKKRHLQKKISLPNGGRTAVLHRDSSWSARMIIKTKWEKMSVLNQTSIQKLLIDIYFGESAFC